MTSSRASKAYCIQTERHGVRKRWNAFGNSRQNTRTSSLARHHRRNRRVLPPDGCRDSNCVVYRDTDTAFFSYTPPSSTVKPCWHAWSADSGDGPAETGGTLHFCNVAGSFVTFTLPSNGSAADLVYKSVYKSGPDCGIMDITSTSGLTHSLLISIGATANTMVYVVR